jgi:uncharacterized protein YlaN (UPF0358 family)
MVLLRPSIRIKDTARGRHLVSRRSYDMMKKNGNKIKCLVEKFKAENFCLNVQVEMLEESQDVLIATVHDLNKEIETAKATEALREENSYHLIQRMQKMELFHERQIATLKKTNQRMIRDHGG